MNELGLYLGDKQGMKGGCHVYRPYWYRIITYTYTDIFIMLDYMDCIFTYLSGCPTQRRRTPDLDIRGRAHGMIRQASVCPKSGLGWGQVESAMLDLVKDKPLSDAPRPAVEDPEPPTDDDSDDEDNDPAPPSKDDESEDETMILHH